MNLEASQKFLLSLYNVLADQTPSAPTQDLESTLGSTRTQLEAISQKIPARLGSLNVGFDSSQMSYFDLRQTIYNRMKDLISSIERAQGVLFPTIPSSAPPVEPFLFRQPTSVFQSAAPINSTSSNVLSGEAKEKAHELLMYLQNSMTDPGIKQNQSIIQELCESLKVGTNSPFAKKDGSAQPLAETLPPALAALKLVAKPSGKLEGIICNMQKLQNKLNPQSSSRPRPF